MNPQYVRFVIPNSNPQYNSPAIYQPNSFSSFQILNRITPSIPASAPRIIITSRLPAPNLSNGITVQESNNMTIPVSANQTLASQSSSCVNIPIIKSNCTEVIPRTDTCTNIAASIHQSTTQRPNVPRNDFPCPEEKQQIKKKKKLKRLEEKGLKSTKRTKNWSIDETTTFIGVWSDYYEKLMSGGKRNSPIYESMANQLNEMFKDRSVNGADVKSKIGNLVTEYRRKKKEQGKTGASPSSWAYYDLIDRIIGERPYNDDSLLTDSMNVEEEQFEDIDNNDKQDLNSTQISLQVNDSIETTTNNEEIKVEERIDTTKTNQNMSASSYHGASLSKVDTPVKNASKVKKNGSGKKKRTTEIKIDLMKELMEKIEYSGDSASQTETKMLELLERQTRLQELSMQTEKEFLNVFKDFMGNMTTNK